MKGKNTKINILNSNKNNSCGKKKQNKVKTKRKYIPKKIREQVWTTNIGLSFQSKCNVDWCSNIINVFDYHIGHNIPHSKGGSINLSNLKPICSRCNLSMSNNYTIVEWGKLINNDVDFNIDKPNKKIQQNNLLMKIKHCLFFFTKFNLY